MLPGSQRRLGLLGVLLVAAHDQHDIDVCIVEDLLVLRAGVRRAEALAVRGATRTTRRVHGVERDAIDLRDVRRCAQRARLPAPTSATLRSPAFFGAAGASSTRRRGVKVRSSAAQSARGI